MFITTVTQSALPDQPTNIVLTGIGARAIQVQWMHSGNFGDIEATAHGFIIRVSSVSENDNSMINVSVPEAEARSHVIAGLQPYQYFSSQGVQFNVSVIAVNDLEASSYTVHSITLPCE